MSDEPPPSDDLVWLTPLRPQRGLIEPWRRKAAVAPDGLVFVPAALAGNETTVHLAAAWEDDMPTVYDDAGHGLPVAVRREKARIFSGCDSRLASGRSRR